uniref:Uncharacterized protein n=1 Tax=Knipowitschia caucasica TaxID=637954 RepID=A0AAV2L5P1_KNICA
MSKKPAWNFDKVSYNLEQRNNVADKGTFQVSDQCNKMADKCLDGQVCGWSAAVRGGEGGAKRLLNVRPESLAEWNKEVEKRSGVEVSRRGARCPDDLSNVPANHSLHHADSSG